MTDAVLKGWAAGIALGGVLILVGTAAADQATALLGLVLVALVTLVALYWWVADVAALAWRHIRRWMRDVEVES